MTSTLLLLVLTVRPHFASVASTSVTAALECLANIFVYTILGIGCLGHHPAPELAWKLVTMFASEAATRAAAYAQSSMSFAVYVLEGI